MTAPSPSDHLHAGARAVALVALAERGDNDAYADLLTDIAEQGEEAVGATVYGLVCLVSATLTLAGVHGQDRIELLDGLAADTTREAGRE